MTNDEVKKNIWRNSASNYLFLVARLGLGVVIFRLLWQNLSKEEFGFWALLWSVFGYGILLDFGFGFTALKRVAELSVHKDWDQLGKVLSTIFFSYVMIAAGMLLLGLLASPLVIKAFKITAENEPYFREVFLVFLFGMSVAFPLGIFPEVLRGQQRISLANNIFLGTYLLSFAMVCLIIKYGGGLKLLLCATMGSSIVADLLCGYFAFKRMPDVRLHPSLFSKGMIVSTMRFSIFAYITTLTTLILTRTDQLVISTVLAVSAVALYQAGAKIGEMFSSLAMQIPDVLSPVAAHMNAKGDKKFLQSMLIQGTRVSVMVATPMYLVCAFFMGPLLHLLTGDKDVTQQHAETFWVGQVLLLWTYVMVVTQSVPKRIFMMCGHEKKLMWLGMGEAVMNLVLSVALVFYYKNVVCVAIGSLIATAFFGIFYLWPWAAREANLSALKLARTVLGPTWAACLPVIALLIIERSVPQLDATGSFYLLVAETLIVGVVVVLGMWRVALNAEERAKVLSYARVFTRRTV
ncbi:MAG TPA: oligosaccharide flippase family protein [Methylomirabilota bacterium]|nr:oligosaccharide flippase family protein [Methylomirabilota bacterium]